jgi:hypothetical protein
MAARIPEIEKNPSNDILCHAFSFVKSDKAVSSSRIRNYKVSDDSCCLSDTSCHLGLIGLLIGKLLGSFNPVGMACVR